MSTTGRLYLSPETIYAEPYHKWFAWIGPGTCDQCTTTDDYVHWRFTVPHWRLTLCEQCADRYGMPGKAIPVTPFDPDDGPGENFG